jgi:hypothetical protein
MMPCKGVLMFLLVPILLGCSEERAVFHKVGARAPQAANEAAPDKDAGNAKGERAAEKATPRKIIYTGLVDLIVDDFDQAVQQLRQLVEEHKGYLADSAIHNQPGAPRSGSWTVRVPQKDFEAFMDAAARFGEVRSRTTNSQDITDAYYDSAARMKADETEEKSLLSLLEKTQGKVEDILKVREQLRVVRGQIEQRKSQLQRWDKDVDRATVTIKLLDRRDYTAPIVPDFGSSIGRTFQNSVSALVTFGKALVLVVVALAPWLAVLALLGAPGYVLWRRRRAASALVPEAALVSPAEEDSPVGGDQSGGNA